MKHIQLHGVCVFCGYEWNPVLLVSSHSHHVLSVATLRKFAQSCSKSMRTDAQLTDEFFFLQFCIRSGEDLRSALREVVATQWVFSTPESLKDITTRGSGDIRHQSHPCKIVQGVFTFHQWFFSAVSAVREGLEFSPCMLPFGCTLALCFMRRVLRYYYTVQGLSCWKCCCKLMQ